MHSDLNFSECALSDSLSKYILSDLPLMWFELQLDLRYLFHDLIF